jgi:hypothetical protein
LALFDDLRKRVLGTGRKVESFFGRGAQNFKQNFQQNVGSPLGDVGFNKHLFNADVTKNTFNTARQIGTLKGLGAAGRGVYQGGVLPIAELAARTVIPGAGENQERVLRTLRKPTQWGFDPNDEAMKNIQAGFGVAGALAPYGVAENLAMKGAAKILPKVVASKAGKFAMNRAADVASGQVLADPTQFKKPTDRFKQAAADIALGTAGTVVGAGARPIIKKVEKIAVEQPKLASFANRLDAPIPDTVTTVLPNGSKVTRPSDYKTVSLSEQEAVQFMKTGNRPEVPVRQYGDAGKQVHFTIDPRTDEVVSWTIDRPQFAQSFMQRANPSFGLSTRRAKASELPQGKDPKANATAANIERAVKNGAEVQGPLPDGVMGPPAPITKQRGFVTSVQEAPNVKKGVKKLTKGTYTPKENEALMGEAKALLTDGGTIDFGNTKDLDKKVAATIQTALNEQAAGNPQAAANLYNSLSEQGTNLGRGVQAFNLLEKMSPEAIALSAAGQIKKFNRIHGKQIPELSGDQVSLIGEKVKRIMGMAEGREKNIALNDLENTLSGFIPSSFADKAMAVWKAGLLTSLRTHERNFFGNAIHGIAEVAKDVPAAGADMLMSGTTGKRSMSVALRGMGEFGSKSTRQQMADIVMKGFDPTEQINKFDYKKVTWANTPVQQFFKGFTDLTFNSLGASDKPFFNPAFARSLYDQAGTAAINAGRRGDMKFIQGLVDSPTDEMFKIATIDASTATFKNKNAASQIAANMKRAAEDAGQKFGGDVGGQVGKVVSEMTLPFTGVPSSILGQTIAYSPIGLVKGMAKVGRVVAGQVPELQRQAAQELGRGVIGTGIFGLGAYLAGKGLITGQPKDAEEARLWDAQNIPRNSIMVNGKWRSLNSIGPESLVALAGAKLNEELGKEDGSLANYGVSLAKDQLDQSFLRGVQSPMNAITDPKRYAKGYVGGLVSSVVPNIVKDAAKATDDTQRETNTVLDYARAGVPGNPFGLGRKGLLPKRDVLGNEMKQEPSGIGAFIDVFNSKTPNTGQVVNELSRLYSVGNGATPTKLDKSFSVFGQPITLTPKELDGLEASSGGEITKRFQTVMNTPGYSEIPDEDKAKLLNGIVDSVRSTEKKRLFATGGISTATPISAGETLSTTAATTPAGRPSKDQLDIAKFQVEQDQQTRKIGDTYVYYDPESGTAKFKTEKSITNSAEEQQLVNDLEAALETKDYAKWRTTAEKQYAMLEAENAKLDPVLDGAKILANQNKMQELQLNYLKYKGYGGLSKPKKGKSLKRSTVGKATTNRKPKIVKASTPKVSIKQQTLKKSNLATNGTAKRKQIRKSVI